MLPQTKLICTLGPSTESAKAIEKLARSGMSVARINLSHGDHEYHKELVKNIQETQKNIRHHITVAFDTRGPECRVILNRELYIRKGMFVKFVLDKEFIPLEDSGPVVGLNIGEIPSLKTGNHVFLDDMKLEMVVVEIGHKYFIARSKGEYKLQPWKRVAFPGMSLSLPFLQESDVADVKFAEEQNADAIFVSFVQSAKDIQAVRNILTDKSIQLIAKIETTTGANNIGEIIQESDGIMIARGDLCTAVGVSNMFSIQKQLIRAVRQAEGCVCTKPIIMATEMLQNMVNSRNPTRAEISDVGNAVFDGCSSVMLSAESASGKYPYRSIRTLKKICIDAERYLESSDETLREDSSGNYESETMDRIIIRKKMLRKGCYCFVKNFSSGR